jgi:hypothetical protein
MVIYSYNLSRFAPVTPITISNVNGNPLASSDGDPKFSIWRSLLDVQLPRYRALGHTC